jgi:uncharacterized protein YcgL (UPF0745 family)
MCILKDEVNQAGAAMKPCKVFRSDKKAEAYLYLADDMEFDDLPTQLQERFGEPAFVLRLELSTDRNLARVDVTKVLESLVEHGYYLQLPPKMPVEEEITRQFS